MNHSPVIGLVFLTCLSSDATAFFDPLMSCRRRRQSVSKCSSRSTAGTATRSQAGLAILKSPAQQRAALRAVKEVDARIRGHRFGRRKSTLRAGQRAFQLRRRTRAKLERTIARTP